MICMECGKELKQISYKHLKSCCSLTTYEYKNKYNIQFLMDKDIRNKCSNAGNKNGNYKHGKCCTQQYCTKCNVQITGRGKTSLCVSCSKIGKLNPFYDKKHNAITRQTMKDKAKFRDKSTYYKIPMTPELIARISITNKKHWQSLTTEEKNKKLEKLNHSCTKKSGTKIEKIMQKVLDDIGIYKDDDYQTNVCIGRFNVDILVHHEFIIECYGDYWHKNPKLYNSLKDIEKRKSDEYRKKYLKNKGYKFINFWETEIHNELETVKKRLEIFFGSYMNLFEWESCSR